MEEYKTNHLAVWILVIVNQLLGAVWYSKLAFGRLWMELLGANAADFTSTSILPYLLSIASAVLIAYTFAWLFKRLNVVTWVDGLRIALRFWLVFAFLVGWVHAAFAMRPFGLIAIDMGREFVNFGLIGVVLGEWKRK